MRLLYLVPCKILILQIPQDFLEPNRSLILTEQLNDQIIEVQANDTLVVAEELLRQARYLEANATRITYIAV